MRVVFAPLAERHLRDLRRFIRAEAGVAIADGYVDRIVAFCSKLDLFPHRGTKHDEILPGLRTIGFERRATIAFVIDEDIVLVEGVFYGGRNIASGFD